MKKGKKGEMNIDFTELYDQEDDVYYVTFNTGEPSFVVEVDDIFLLEVGMYTGLPTGFRILNYSDHKVSQVSFAMQKIKEQVEQVRKDIPQNISNRSRQVETVLKKVFA